MSNRYEGVFFNASKERFIGRAVIDGKRKDLVSDKNEAQCALKRNVKLVELLGAEEAAPFLNDIAPDDLQAAPAEAPQEAPQVEPEAPGAGAPKPYAKFLTTDALVERVRADSTGADAAARDELAFRVMTATPDVVIEAMSRESGESIEKTRADDYAKLEAARAEFHPDVTLNAAPQVAGVPAMADEYPDDLPFPVTEAQFDAALTGAGAPDDEDLRPAPLPDLGDAALSELEAAGIVNLHDSVKATDDRLFKLRSMTPKNLDRLRAAEVAAGLREAPDAADAAFMAENGAAPLLTPQDAPKGKKAKAEKPVVTPAPADIDMPMSVSDRADFDRLRNDAAESSVKLWRALAQISERRLYREKFPTFEAFVAAEFEGKGRQWAYQLVSAAKTADALAVIDVQPTTERQARELSKAAKVVTKMTPDEQQIVAQVVKGLTGTDTPSAAQVNAVVEVSSALYATGTIEDPDTGEAVRLTDLAPARRAALLQENVTNATHERLKRQEAHIAEKGKQSKTLSATGSTGNSAAAVNASSWADWLMNYAAQGLSHDHEVRLTVRKDPSGNPQAVAQVIVSATGEVIAEGEPNTRYVKGTVMSLIERLKYGGEVK